MSGNDALPKSAHDALPKSAHDALPGSAHEEVDLVDEENRIVGVASRRDVRRLNLPHRGVGILCRSPRGEVYVHKRTDTKDLFPGLYDMFVGGVVGRGETYLDAATREICEELGVHGVPLRRLFTHLYRGDRNHAWIAVYDVMWDGPVVHQEDEIAWGGWIAEDALTDWARSVEVVPDGRSVFERWLAWQREGGVPEAHPSPP